MTAVAAPAAVRTAPRARFAGMGWVIWRQHRFALLGAGIVLGGFAALMIVNGLAMHADLHRLGLDHCRPADCPQNSFELFQHRYQSIASFLPRLLMIVPGLIGAFLGAPVIARELETGTFRFAWTQGTDRRTWTLAKLTVLGAVLVVLALAFTALFSWWYQPWLPYRGRIAAAQAYEVEGTVFAARMLFAFSLGVLLGALIRRTVAAIAGTLALWLGFVVSTVLYVRPHLVKPIVSQDKPTIPGNAWTISDWFQDRAGHHLSDNQVNNVLSPPVRAGTNGRGLTRTDFNDVLARHGVTHWIEYQPNGRFWHFQLLETGAYVVLSLLLAALAVWWVRRHAT